MRYITEHSCQLRPPDEFQQKTYRRIYSGRADIVIARPHGLTKTRAQAIRYPIELWTEKQAKTSCKQRGGKFTPAQDRYDGPKFGASPFQRGVGGLLSEPWRMTPVEYSLSMKQQTKANMIKKGYSNDQAETFIRSGSFIRAVDKAHEEHVTKAMEAGKPVPRGAYEDYLSEEDWELPEDTKFTAINGKIVPPGSQKRAKPLPTGVQQITVSKRKYNCSGKTDKRGTFRVYCRRS